MRLASTVRQSSMKAAFPSGSTHGRGLVADQDLRFVAQGAGDALALAPGEPDPLVAYQGVVALGQAADEGVRLRRPGSGLDLRFDGVRVACRRSAKP